MAIFPSSFFGAEVWQRMIAAKDEKTAQRVMLGTAFVNTIVYIPIYLLPFFGLQFASDAGAEQLLAASLSSLSPIIAPVILVGLFAIIMSSLDTACFLAAQALVNDGFAKIRPDIAAHPRKHLKHGIVVTLIISTIMALFFTNVVENFYFLLTLWIALTPLCYPLLLKKWPGDRIIAISVFVITFVLITTQFIGWYNDYIGLALFIGGGIFPVLVTTVMKQNTESANSIS